MSNLLFHNKFHSSNHHTVSSYGFIDSGIDPIASQQYPFIGTFHNLLSGTVGSTTIIQGTDSREWQNMFATVFSVSANWSLYNSIDTTWGSLSSGWRDGYIFYLVNRSLSSRVDSTYFTVTALSANWPFLDRTLRTDLQIESTKAKIFKCADIVPTVTDNTATFVWDLSAQQVAFLSLNQNITALNPQPTTNIKKGGEYILIIYQEDPGNYTVRFDSKFNITSYDGTNYISPSAFSYTVIKFTSDGEILRGNTTNYYGNLLADVTYFAGSGISIDPNPAGLFYGEYFLPATGLIVQNRAPYTATTSINILTGETIG